MSHTVTITKLPGLGSDNIEWEFGGTHDGTCEFYAPCKASSHRHPKNPEQHEDGWSTKRTPQHHAYLDGEWMVPVDQNTKCALAFVFETNTPEDILQDLALGETRDVVCSWDSESWELEVNPNTRKATK